MGRRQRRRTRDSGAAQVPTVDYADDEGNVLTLRERVSDQTAAKLRELHGAAGASREDLDQRRVELLFERLAVRWTIAGLPLEGQRELLGRYRMAGGDTRSWVRATLAEHVARHQPELEP